MYREVRSWKPGKNSHLTSQPRGTCLAIKDNERSPDLLRKYNARLLLRAVCLGKAHARVERTVRGTREPAQILLSTSRTGALYRGFTGQAQNASIVLEPWPKIARKAGIAALNRERTLLWATDADFYQGEHRMSSNIVMKQCS